MSSSEDDDTYINEGEIEGEKPEITEEERNELLKKGEDSKCQISLPDINQGNGFFFKFYIRKKNIMFLL